MHLDFTQEQDELRDSVRTVLERECPPTLIRSLFEGAENAGASVTALWERVVGLDWPALALPEDAGGVGYGFVEMAIVAEEAGRALLPGPLLPTVGQFVPAVREAGTGDQQKRFLGAVAAGETTGTLALAEPAGRWDLDGLATTATRDGDGWSLTGTKKFVVEAAGVDEIAVVAAADAGAGVFVVPAEACEITAIDTLDATRSIGEVTLDGVRVDADRALGEPGSLDAAIGRAIEEATTVTALETLGTAQAVFDMTLDYAKEREQFDRPIGSFQAIKHKLADCLVALERARASCYFAVACIAEDDGRRALAVSVAKAAAGDAQRAVTREGIQIHGGIGYTWEHDLQMFVKRAKVSEALFGTSAQHRDRIARLVADRRLEHHGPRWTLDGR